MMITRETMVKDALESCREAQALFEAHGIDPLDKCKGMYDMVSLDEAESWCKVKDVDDLIDALNAALERPVVHSHQGA